ncbi:MAG: hypothetical protein HY725_17085 [Candidatus Rokubacteria bacterium]|nr:hypothetical protein [Candidatus Rokubacteria bacterium]
MTLVLNEIHLLDGLNSTVLVAAADRRISSDGGYFGTHPKLFRIPYLHGAISYFGLAVFRDSAANTCRFWDWLPAFIKRQTGVRDLRTFAYNLRDALHQLIPADTLRKAPSGFHICGYNEQFFPDYWFLTNIREMKGYAPSRIESSYKAPGSHFLCRDAAKLGWDGQDPSSARSKVMMIYRNVDFRARAVVWKQLKHMWQFPDFMRPQRSADYRDYVRFKFEFIAHLYRRWGRKEVIAKPIDVMVWSVDSRQRKIEQP